MCSWVSGLPDGSWVCAVTDAVVAVKAAVMAFSSDFYLFFGQKFTFFKKKIVVFLILSIFAARNPMISHECEYSFNDHK
jgi:hypothetical protein